MKNTILEVNTRKFMNNIKHIKEYVGAKEIMPIIKANAYGTYINKRLDILNEFNIVAVAEVQEAIEVRKLGFEKEIFVLNQPLPEELEDIYKYNITIGLSENHFIDKVTKPITVHLEIETGMNRTGIKTKDLDSFINKIKENPNIKVEGIYTHFSSADNDPAYTNKQIAIFQEAIIIAKKYYSLKYIHCSASNGLVNYPEEFSNLIRPGLIMYGYESFPGLKEKLNIEPITTLKTKITYIKDIGLGEAISYNQKYITATPMKVATIPIGYADGLRRNLTNKGEVIVRGEKRKILGAICMDSCMIDVTGLDVEIGEEVTIWDNNLITLEEIANKCDTINYEILATISDRVARNFTEK